MADAAKSADKSISRWVLDLALAAIGQPASVPNPIPPHLVGLRERQRAERDAKPPRVPGKPGRPRKEVPSGTTVGDGHDVAGEPHLTSERVHETPIPTKSWLHLDAEERKRMSGEWLQRGPRPPAGFAGWTPEEKVSWLDANWPLAEPEKQEEW